MKTKTNCWAYFTTLLGLRVVIQDFCPGYRGQHYDILCRPQKKAKKTEKEEAEEEHHNNQKKLSSSYTNEQLS